MIQHPPTKYAQSGDISIAYQITGDGPLDLIVTPGHVSHLDHAWEEPSFARCLERLGSFSRLIRFDKRGTGLSDREAGIPSLEQRMDDIRAVMDSAGSKRAASSPRRSLTFEVDGVDQDRQLGWNAVLRGPTEEVTDSINSPDFGAFPWWRGTPPLLTHQIEPGDRHAHHDCRPAANWQG